MSTGQKVANGAAHCPAYGLPRVSRPVSRAPPYRTRTSSTVSPASHPAVHIAEHPDRVHPPRITLVVMSAPARLLCLALFANSAWCVDDGLCRR
ncbi:hypothetical protein FMM49_04760 [Streptomyces rimosus subsp. rimosus]|nr:hypothetical protein CTZ40_04210 [Streptomyces rimosus]QEV74341.1 hypothetical protein CP984_04200 [Streptomyces rimosus]QTL85148.1 hypothetical protein FMM49_04760 [Streptomyces rimosus subsp. rimosus]